MSTSIHVDAAVPPAGLAPIASRHPALRSRALVTDRDPTVDLAFPLRGDPLPLDHGYPLFGALSHLLPTLHAHPAWGVHPVLGRREERRLHLEPVSRLKLRLPLAELGAVLPLAQATLDVAGARVSLGFPQVFPLDPAASIRARFVTIAGFQEAEPFVAALARQIAELPELAQDPASIEITLGRRRTCEIHGKRIVGFAVGLMGLHADASLLVQRHGLGGRRHMGAGIFVPPGRRG
jgi:CRISPR-associated protein Cas6